jgi:dienelactone hydrolase
MRLMTRGRLAAVLLIVILAGAVFAARPYLRGLSFVVRAADRQGSLRRLADYDAVAVAERELQIPIASRTIAGRAYMPASPARRAVLLVPGLPLSGPDEPQVNVLARQLAASGVAVVVPDIEDLRQFTISTAITDHVEQSASWLAAQSEFAPDGRIGLLGINISGGLTLIAAGRPGLKDRVAFVAALGGHDDLARVFKYLCTGVEAPPPESASPLTGLMQQRDAAKTAGTPAAVATGWTPPPTDDGAAIVLVSLAERVVPAAQVEPLRGAVRQFLQTSLNGDEASRGETLGKLRAVAKTMREPSATLFKYVLDRDIVHLGARLAPGVASFANAAALSPARSPKPSAPVFLLHGTADNVVPAVETLHLSATLRGTTPTRMLLSSAVSENSVKQQLATREMMQLAAFWSDILKK